jgi:hypothetical protein
MNFFHAPGVFSMSPSTTTSIVSAIGTVTVNTAAVTGKWTSVVYGNGVYVAVQTLTPYTVARSTDGITWTTVTGAFAGTSAIVAFGNGLFVAVCAAQGSTNATASAPLWTSPDGITWTKRSASNIGTAHVWMAVNYTNSKFIVVSNFDEVSTSIDGITWTNFVTATGVSPYVIVGDNAGRVVIAGGALNVNLSTNTGTSWATVGSVATNIYWMAYGGSPAAFVTSTTAATMVNSYHSATGAAGTWSAPATTQAGTYTGIAASPTRFVMISNTGTLITSTDGSNWSIVDTTGITIPSLSWAAICYDSTNSRFVALSNSGGATIAIQ